MKEISYALGLNIWNNLLGAGVKQLELNTFLKGVQDALESKALIKAKGFVESFRLAHPKTMASRQVQHIITRLMQLAIMSRIGCVSHKTQPALLWYNSDS